VYKKYLRILKFEGILGGRGYDTSFPIDLYLNLPYLLFENPVYLEGRM